MITTILSTRLTPRLYEVVEQIRRRERRTTSQMISLLVEEALTARGIDVTEPPSAKRRTRKPRSMKHD